MKDIRPKSKILRYIVFSLMMLPLIYLVGWLVFFLIKNPKLFSQIMLHQVQVLIVGFVVGGIVLLVISFLIFLIKKR